MVDLINAYGIINKDILRVVNDLVPLTVLEVKDKTVQHRMKETTFSISDSMTRLVPVVVGHNLTQYVNKFYSIGLVDNENNCLLDYLIDIDTEDIDMSGFGGR